MRMAGSASGGNIETAAQKFVGKFVMVKKPKSSNEVYPLRSCVMKVRHVFFPDKNSQFLTVFPDDSDDLKPVNNYGTAVHRAFDPAQHLFIIEGEHVDDNGDPIEGYRGVFYITQKTKILILNLLDSMLIHNRGRAQNF